MKALCIVILLSLFSCVCRTPIIGERTNEDFVTAHGIEVHPQDNFFSADEIEMATEVLTDCLVKRFPNFYTKEDLYHAYLGAQVFIESSDFSCVVKNPDSEEDELVMMVCSGTYRKMTNKIRFTYEDCIGDTSFVHEMLHLVEAKVDKNDYDYHSDKGFFSDEAGSVEYDVNQYLIEMNCPRCVEYK